TVGCNYVANAYQGIYVNGNCPAMLMQGNLIDKNKYGLYYGSSITVSNQFLTGNEFRNQASNYSSTAAFKVTGPAFYTLIPGSIHLNYQFTPPSQTPGNFFVPVTQGTNFQCLIQQSFDYCGVTHQEPREKDGLDDKIANREIEPEFFEDETYYQLDQYLFSKLKENSAMRDTDTTMQSYFLQMQNNVIADFSDVKDQADEMLSIDQVATVTLEQNNSAIDALQLNVESIQNQFQNDNLTNQEVEQLTNNIITSEQSIQTLRSLNNDIVEQLKSGRLLSAAQISQINGSIGTTELIASNDKAINEICLATISIGEFNFSQAQGSTILSIAQQCPISGGEAVYRARSLYKLIDPTMIYDDINTCLQEGIIYRKAHPNSNNVIYAFVIPNPALNFAELQYSIIAENADVVFYNTIGQKIDRINLNCKMNVLSLNLDQFENGVYFFQIIADGKPGINGKLIVQK
ncbi:MAG: T9SS type A sorting domain-containing protein, partial [Bacteroidota bacterium]